MLKFLLNEEIVLSLKITIFYFRKIISNQWYNKLKPFIIKMSKHIDLAAIILEI